MATAVLTNPPRPAIAEPLELLRPVLRRWRGRLALIVAVGLASAFAETASIGLVLLLLAILFGDGAQSPIITDSPLAFAGAWLPPGLNPGWAAFGLFLAIVLRLALTAWHGCLSAAFSVRIGHETRVRLFRSIVEMPLETAHRQSWGELYALVDEHSNAVPRALEAVCDGVHALTVLALVGLLLLAVAPVEAAIGIVSVLVLNRAMARLRRPVERAGEDHVAATKAMSEGLIRTLHALRTFQVLGLAGRQQRRFTIASGRVAQARMKAVALALVANPASHISALAAVTVMALSSSVLGSGPGTLLVAVGLLYRLEPYAATLQSAQIRLNEQAPALRRLAGIPEPPARAGGRMPPERPGPIRLRDVSFAYGSRERPVIERLDLAIPADGWTLVEGPSGAGKSTLVNLLLGLIEPSSGRITVGDVPLHAIDQAAWRRGLAVCGQDIELIGGTLRDNLLLGTHAPSAAALAEAIETAGLAPLLAELPQGLDTELGERGVQLSGGQRQRLAIARAILRRPRLLILDEATSMLDKASEALILAGLARLMQGRTVIVIGHDLPSLPPITAHISLAAPDAPAEAPPQASFG